jgi:predicted transcriptional regulator
MSRQRFPKEFHESLEKLSEIIPKNGILYTPENEMAKQLNIRREAIRYILNKLTMTRPPLAVKEENRYVFDYTPKEIERAAHFQAALSNMGLSPNDF